MKCVVFLDTPSIPLKSSTFPSKFCLWSYGTFQGHRTILLNLPHVFTNLFPPHSFSLSLALPPAKVIHHLIDHAQYESLMGDDLVNLAVVMEDEYTQERVLASEEFNITSPQLSIQVQASLQNVSTHRINFTRPLHILRQHSTQLTPRLNNTMFRQ